MIDKKLVLLLLKNGHNQSGIAIQLGVSRQRIHQVARGYKTLHDTFFKYSPKFKRQKNSMVNKLEQLLNKGCGICRYQATVFHHIDKNSKNNDLKNIMALCVKCHYEIHLGEKTKKIIGEKRIPTWSRKYKECIICNSSKKMYGGYGLCALCYHKNWYHKKKQEENLN